MNYLIKEKRENFRKQIRRQHLNVFFQIKRCNTNNTLKEIVDNENNQEDQFYKLMQCDELQCAELFREVLKRTNNTYNDYIKLLLLFLNHNQFKQFLVNESELLYFFKYQLLHKLQSVIIDPENGPQEKSKFLLIIFESEILSFEDLKEPFLYCCNQIQNNLIDIDLIFFMIKLIQKYENEGCFFWNVLYNNFNNSETVWMKIQSIISQNDQEFLIQKYLLKLIQYLLKIFQQQDEKISYHKNFIYILHKNISFNNVISSVSAELLFILIQQGHTTIQQELESLEICKQILFSDDIPYQNYISILKCVFIIIEENLNQIIYYEILNIIIYVISQSNLQSDGTELLLQFLLNIFGKLDQENILFLIKNKYLSDYFKSKLNNKNKTIEFFSYQIFDKYFI